MLLPLNPGKRRNDMNKTFDRYASVIFFVLGLSIFIYSQTLTKASFGSSIGPSAMPAFLSIILMILSVIGLISAIRNKSEVKKGEKLDYKRFLFILGALILYVFLLEPLGYVISTFLFLFAGFQAMEKGSYLKTAIIAAVFSVGVYYLYVVIAKGSLPPLPFLDL